MKINIQYEEKEYKAVWWINALNCDFSAIAEWETI